VYDGGNGYDGRMKLLATIVEMEVVATIAAMGVLAMMTGWRYWL